LLGFFIDDVYDLLFYCPFNVVVAVVVPRVVAYTVIVKYPTFFAVTERRTSLLNFARIHSKPHIITMTVTIGVATRCTTISIVIRGGFLNAHDLLHRPLIFSVDIHDLEDVCVKDWNRECPVK
jgi:hypothetical protein